MAPRSRWARLPTALTVSRIALLPLLWGVALLDRTAWLGLGLAIVAGTDVADGTIARHFGWTTRLGSRLDSIADHLLTGSTLAWLVWLRWSFVSENLLPLAAWIGLGTTALFVGWVRFRRIGDLHLYSAKIAGTAGYLFAVWVLIFDAYSPFAFTVVISLCLLASAETLLVMVTRHQVDEHVGSILREAPGRRTGAGGPNGRRRGTTSRG